MEDLIVSVIDPEQQVTYFKGTLILSPERSKILFICGANLLC